MIILTGHALTRENDFVSMHLINFFSNQDKIALNRSHWKGHITQLLSVRFEVYGRRDAAEGLLQFKHYWNKLLQSKRQSTLCSTGANVNIMAVGCATAITIANLLGLLFTFAD